MKVDKSGFYLDSASIKLLDCFVSYEGVTDAAGNAGGTTLVCADLANHSQYPGGLCIVLDGGAAGQARRIVTDVAGTITVASAFTDAAGAAQQIAAGVRFKVLMLDMSDFATILTRLGRVVCSLDFWSNSQEEVQLTAVAADKALPDIVVEDIPAGATVLRSILMFKFRAVEDTSAVANALDGAQDIQIRDDSPSAWIDGINFVDGQFGVAASIREGSDVFIGDIDVSGTVDGNDTYNVQWDEALSLGDNLQFNDIQVGLRIWFTL